MLLPLFIIPNMPILSLWIHTYEYDKTNAVWGKALKFDTTFAFFFSSHLICSSQNCRIYWVGRDLRGSSKSNSWPFSPGTPLCAWENCPKAPWPLPWKLFQCLTTLRGKTSFQYPAKSSSLDSFSSDFKFSLWYVRHSLLLCLVQHIYLWWLKVFAEVNLKYLKHWGVAVGFFFRAFFQFNKTPQYAKSAVKMETFLPSFLFCGVVSVMQVELNLVVMIRTKWLLGKFRFGKNLWWKDLGQGINHIFA